MQKDAKQGGHENGRRKGLVRIFLVDIEKQKFYRESLTKL
jgi:hypothetical protein